MPAKAKNERISIDGFADFPGSENRFLTLRNTGLFCEGLPIQTQKTRSVVCKGYADRHKNDLRKFSAKINRFDRHRLPNRHAKNSNRHLA